ncbi:hypothetical protein E4U31_006491 [Claviceps sp. LM219 group G6]|nr:hypothetical protein E4U31_006491 [Claviceps sp. LM219 group G6]
MVSTLHSSAIKELVELCNIDKDGDLGPFGGSEDGQLLDLGGELNQTLTIHPSSGPNGTRGRQPLNE